MMAFGSLILKKIVELQGLGRPMTLLLVLAVFCLAGAAFFVGEVVTLPVAAARSRPMRRAATLRRSRSFLRRAARQASRTLLMPVARSGSRAGRSRMTPRANIDGDRAQAEAAGMSRRISPTGFLAVKGSCALGGLFVGSAAGLAARRRRPAAGRAALRRRRLPRAGLRADHEDARPEGARSGRRCPTRSTCLPVSVEAGLGFDAALAKLNEHMEGPLAEEFGLMLPEMRIGESRSKALKRLSERVDAPELSPSPARSSRPTSSACRSAASCACRPPTRACAARPPPRSGP